AAQAGFKRADPKEVLIVFADGGDVVVAGSAVIAAENILCFSRGEFKDIEPAAIGTDPKPARLVERQDVNEVLAYGTGVAGVCSTVPGVQGIVSEAVLLPV